LIGRSRTDLADHKRPFAHDHEPVSDLLGAIRSLRPSALIGVSGAPGSFTRDVIETMVELNERPVVFALSNPTSKSECTARQSYEWSQGRALFASGSPFPPVELDGRTFVPGQGNNAYVFPGIGMGAIHAEATSIPNEMFLVAARALAGEVSPSDLAVGRLYPSLTRIRDVSASIATAVAEVAYERGLARRARPSDLHASIRDEMYQPEYPRYA
jgi:malate dehydrogenase (oxaloacetate-decarboxylating)(NADP+)